MFSLFSLTNVTKACGTRILAHSGRCPCAETALFSGCALSQLLACTAGSTHWFRSFGSHIFHLCLLQLKSNFAKAQSNPACLTVWLSGCFGGCFSSWILYWVLHSLRSLLLLLAGDSFFFEEWKFLRFRSFFCSLLLMNKACCLFKTLHYSESLK